jgi:hypothetical protein
LVIVLAVVVIGGAQIGAALLGQWLVDSSRRRDKRALYAAQREQRAALEPLRQRAEHERQAQWMRELERLRVDHG